MKRSHWGVRPVVGSREAPKITGLLVVFAASAACQVQVTDGSGSGGSADAAGGATNGSGGVNAASGGAVVAAGGTVSTGGSGNNTGQGGASTAGTGGSNAASTQEDCSQPDAIGNDDREHAVNLASGATICVTNSSDSDWFYIDTPNDNRAHVIQVNTASQPDSWVDFEVIAQADGSNMGRVHASQRGLKMSSFLTVGPGTRTLFEFYGFVTSTQTTTITVTESAEADEHEPNNDKDTASSIQAASEVSGMLILPYVSATNQAIEDWYRADLTAGKHTLKFTAVPTDLYPNVQVTDSSGVVLATGHGPNRGATFELSFTAEAASTYYFRLNNFVDIDALYSGVKADSYTKPYKFRID
ncbi:MAG: hypothetical protein ACOY0T_05390 [Myxococcota bacterium]